MDNILYNQVDIDQKVVYQENQRIVNYSQVNIREIGTNIT